MAAAVTLAFAVLTVLFSNWYMGSADNRRSVTFLDIGENGTIARRNHFQVLFRGVQGRVVTGVRQGQAVARVGSPDFRWAVLAIQIQAEVGGNLAEVLTTVAATLRVERSTTSILPCHACMNE